MALTNGETAVMISHGNVYTSLAQHTIIGLTDLAEHEFDVSETRFF